MIDEQTQKELLALDWRDFSAYPKRDQRVLIHAKGFDTKEKVWKHLFFDVEHFNLLLFPTNEMNEVLTQHHCKWNFEWLPSKTEN